MTMDSRETCRELIKSSIPMDKWEKNERYSREIKAMIEGHRIRQHPLIGLMREASLDVAALKTIHLEFRYTFAQIFTDSLIQAMYMAGSLEPLYGPTAKVSARYMLQYNVLDELGFAPSASSGGDYGGSPLNAHYLKFDETLSQLGVPWQEAQHYKPSAAAVAVREAIEATYGDYALLLGTLAVAETVFDGFAGAWSNNVTKRTNVDTREGYHSIHIEHEGKSMDDLHSEDLWYVFRQAVDPARYDEIRTKVAAYLETLVGLVDSMVSTPPSP